jgi:hypothetical protein
VQDIVNQAQGNSVTVDRINGDEKYYPDASLLFEEPYHRDGEIPHYTILLTTSFPREIGDPVVGKETGFKTESGRGQLVVTNQAVHFVGNNPTIVEMPYGNINAIEARTIDDCGTLSFYVDGREEKFICANSAGDPDNVLEATGYIREQIQ